jgi:hypothetical protein
VYTGNGCQLPHKQNQKGEYTMNTKLRSACMMVGDVGEIVNDQQLTLVTKVMILDRDSNEKVQKVDNHPVLVPKDVLPKIKEDKRLAFSGWIRRHNNVTKLQLNPKHYTQKPKDIKALQSLPQYIQKFQEVEGVPYLNVANVSGLVIWQNPLQYSLSIGIATPGTTGEAIFANIRSGFAKVLATVLETNTVEVLIDGFMRAREMTGERIGEIMYELVASNRGASQILSKEPIKTLLTDKSPDMSEMLAFEFDSLAIETPQRSSIDQTEPVEEDDLPF